MNSQYETAALNSNLTYHNHGIDGVQTHEIDRMITDGLYVDIFLLNGAGIHGTIMAQGREIIVIKGRYGRQVIYKAALVSINPHSSKKA